MTAHPALAALFALFAWWFSTGIILLAVRRADQAGGMAPSLVVLWGLPFLALGLVMAWTVQAQTGLIGIYQGFIAALCIWGWIELAFLGGVICGPNRAAWDGRGSRVWAAWRVVAWHECALLAALTYLVWLSIGADNAMAALTFGTLWIARVLAKLNLFLGVPGINLEAVPSRLAHIPSYFRQGDPSWLFPISIMILGTITAMWIAQTANSVGPQAAGSALLAALTGLALFEHWMMLLPLADTKLWRWLVPARETRTEPRLELGET